MTIIEAYTKLLQELHAIYDNREAANIADLVIENVTGKKKVERIVDKKFLLNSEQENKLENYTQQLLQHKPVQYVLNEAWFAGMKLYVDEAVLIPRPETEELVEWIVADVRSTMCDVRSKEIEIRSLKYEIRNAKSEVQSEKSNDSNFEFGISNLSILDIGSGSGCIAIALKKKISGADVSAVDVSEGALIVAGKNALQQNVEIDFYQLDFLDESRWSNVGAFDIIVCNPPYIKQYEEAAMQKNVLAHEPHLALFVPDDDALIFYKKIALFAQNHLKENGAVYLEINEALGGEVKRLFKSFGYGTVEIKKDLQEKDRMVKVSRV